MGLASSPDTGCSSFRSVCAVLLARRVVTAVHKPYVWAHKLVAQDRTGHMDAVSDMCGPGSIKARQWDVASR